MRNLIKLLLLPAFIVAALSSCSKDENKIYLEGGSAPVLTASVSGSIPLDYAKKDEQGLQLSWKNPEYKFTTGASSQDVNYLIEIDTAGSGFTNPARQTVAVSKELSKTFSQGDFNDYLLNQLVLKPGVSHDLEVRVKSTLGSVAAVPLLSNVLQFAVTPYAIPPKVTPPATGHLYLVGSATAGAWNNPVPVPDQEFTQVSPTLYEITVALKGGQEYLFLPLNGDWGHKYAVKDNTVSGLVNGGDFGYDLSKNFPGPAADGTYKISADFQRGKFTVTRQ